VPSNKQTFSQLKERERKNQQYEINKENMKILGKIENVNSPYGREIWKPRWKDNQKYKDNISRKGNLIIIQNLFPTIMSWSRK
jgi:hypothetical protein